MNFQPNSAKPDSTPPRFHLDTPKNAAQAALAAKILFGLGVVIILIGYLISSTHSESIMYIVISFATAIPLWVGAYIATSGAETAAQSHGGIDLERTKALIIEILGGHKQVEKRVFEEIAPAALKDEIPEAIEQLLAERIIERVIVDHSYITYVFTQHYRFVRSQKLNSGE